MQTESPVKAVLAIGGLDPTGGAGLLLDISAIRAVGLHGAGIVSMITVQDGRGFWSGKSEDPIRLRQSLNTIIQSMHLGATKTGALGSKEIVELIAELAGSGQLPPLVVDPVMQSTSGGTLLDGDAIPVLTRQLMPTAALLTPNLVEASQLTGLHIGDEKDMTRAGELLVQMGAQAVLVKGGHLPGDRARDIFVDRQGNFQVFDGPKHPGGEVRGTGCALASLIAAYLASGHDLLSAVGQARNTLIRAIKQARIVGAGPKVLDFSGL